MKINIKLIINILIILMIIFIISNSMQVAETSDNISYGFVYLLEFLNPFDSLEAFNHLIRKLAHFSEYFMYGSLLSFSKIKKSMPESFLYPLFILPVVDEFVQTFVDGRSGNIKDVLLDYSGLLIAFLVIAYFYKVYKNKKIDKV